MSTDGFAGFLEHGVVACLVDEAEVGRDCAVTCFALAERVGRAKEEVDRCLTVLLPPDAFTSESHSGVLEREVKSDSSKLVVLLLVLVTGTTPFLWTLTTMTSGNDGGSCARRV